MIVGVCPVAVPPSEHAQSPGVDQRAAVVRQAHGLLAEWVLEPSSGQGETVVVTVWPSHEVFDAWIATPERD